MRQCKLRRGRRHQIVWLPVQFAIRGKYLRIQKEDGWLVEAVYRADPPAYVHERKSHRRGDFGSLVAV